MQALQQQMSKAAQLAADRSAAVSFLEDARTELAASQEAAAGLKLELAGSQAEAARLRCSAPAPLCKTLPLKAQPMRPSMLLLLPSKPEPCS